MNIEKLMLRLQETDCSQEVIDQLWQCSNETELLHVLKKQQKDLQRLFDESCAHIDCIDYLIYELEKKDKTMPDRKETT